MWRTSTELKGYAGLYSTHDHHACGMLGSERGCPHEYSVGFLSISTAFEANEDLDGMLARTQFALTEPRFASRARDDAPAGRSGPQAR